MLEVFFFVKQILSYSSSFLENKYGVSMNVSQIFDDGVVVVDVRLHRVFFLIFSSYYILICGICGNFTVVIMSHTQRFESSNAVTHMKEAVQQGHWG